MTDPTLTTRRLYTILYYTILYYNTLYYIILYDVLHYTILYHVIIPYYTILYYVIPPYTLYYTTSLGNRARRPSHCRTLSAQAIQEMTDLPAESQHIKTSKPNLSAGPCWVGFTGHMEDHYGCSGGVVRGT